MLPSHTVGFVSATRYYSLRAIAERRRQRLIETEQELDVAEASMWAQQEIVEKLRARVVELEGELRYVIEAGEDMYRAIEAEYPGDWPKRLDEPASNLGDAVYNARKAMEEK